MPSTTNFLAIPPYTPGHQFTGRSRELQVLTDWAISPAKPVLVLEAIGGMGKSMLCWHWVGQEIQRVVPQHAGIFWYSFYERGADMGDFCAHALAFTAGRPLDEYKMRKTADLAAELIPNLRNRSWLFVLDGLERVLVAYNRYDAAQVRDEELEAAGESSRRKAQDCIRPADSNLLRALIDVAPSKVLISSRLMPSAFRDNSGFVKHGVLHEMLTGLDPCDAEAMLRNIGVNGDSERMRGYLTKNFGCHPLIVGVVGGLVNKFAIAPAGFDRWVDHQADENAMYPEADLVRSRNRILWAAFEDISEDSRTLLARIALISEASDYETLVELNPRRPERPAEVYPPDEWLLDFPECADEYTTDKLAYDQYQSELVRWRNSSSFVEAERFLREAIQDLTSRGLLQSDETAQKYDLHPVVRGYAVNSITPDQREGVAQRVVDHFSSRQDGQSETVQHINDLRNGLQVARTLLHLARVEQAAEAVNRLASALFWSLEAWDVYLALARPFFPRSWSERPLGIENDVLSNLWTNVALSLSEIGRPQEAFAIGQLVLDLDIDLDSPAGVLTNLRNLAVFANSAMQFHSVYRLGELIAMATPILGNEQDLALSHFFRFKNYSRMGDFETAEQHWLQFDRLPRPANRGLYRPGHGEYYLAMLRFCQGSLNEDLLFKVETLAHEGNNRGEIRWLYWLRGEWKLSLQQWAEAAGFFEDNIKMTREVNLDASWSEARLALAQLKLGQCQPFLELADRISSIEDPPYAALADLYLALGEHEKALKYVEAGYKEAWSAGSPYVCWRTLQLCRKIFEALGEPEPRLAPFAPENSQPFSFEAKLFAYLEKKEEEKRTHGEGVSPHVM